MKYMSLRESAVRAARFLETVELPSLPHIPSCALAVGSGNAAATARVLFPTALHATESSYTQLLPHVKTVLVVSASGAKHAPLIVRTAREAGKRVLLVTTRQDAPAAAFASRVIRTPALDEPYSYNVSTYAGMLALLREDHAWRSVPRYAKRLDAFTLPVRPRMITIVVPDAAFWMIPFLLTKGDELFAARLPLRVFTLSELMHAKTIIPHPREVFLLLGVKSPFFLKDRLVLRVPFPSASHAVHLLMAYAVIGRIQEIMPDWFGRHIAAYTARLHQIFGRVERGGKKKDREE